MKKVLKFSPSPATRRTRINIVVGQLTTSPSRVIREVRDWGFGVGEGGGGEGERISG